MLAPKVLDNVVQLVAAGVANRTTRRAGVLGFLGRTAGTVVALTAGAGLARSVFAQFDPCSETYECGECDGPPCEFDGDYCIYDPYCASGLASCSHKICPCRRLCSSFTGEYCRDGCGGCDYTHCSGCC